MAADTSRTEPSQVSFESLKLRPGSSLQIQHNGSAGPSGEVQLLAAVRGQSVMVALKGESGIKTGLEAGKSYTIRGFSGQYDFSFSSHVTQVFKAPFPYAMLAYPGSVEARIVRKEVRTKTSIPAVATAAGSSKPVSVTLVDLSMAGTMINTSTPLGNQGDRITVEVSVTFENSPIQLKLAGQIRYSKQLDDGVTSVGLEFADISQQDKLVLHYVAQSFANDSANINIS